MKNNHVKLFLHNAGVELGAWLLSGSFVAGIAWLAGSLF